MSPNFFDSWLNISVQQFICILPSPTLNPCFQINVSILLKHGLISSISSAAFFNGNSDAVDWAMGLFVGLPVRNATDMNPRDSCLWSLVAQSTQNIIT